MCQLGVYRPHSCPAARWSRSCQPSHTIQVSWDSTTTVKSENQMVNICVCKARNTVRKRSLASPPGKSPSEPPNSELTPSRAEPRRGAGASQARARTFHEPRGTPADAEVQSATTLIKWSRRVKRFPGCIESLASRAQTALHRRKRPESRRSRARTARARVHITHQPLAVCPCPAPRRAQPRRARGAAPKRRSLTDAHHTFERATLSL
jgi:hypothetical protein